MADERERKRARLSDPDANRWDFLEPWCEQLRGRLVLTPEGYIKVLWPGAHRYGRGEFQTEDNAVRFFTTTTGSVQYTTSDWRTREALELLTLVQYVSHTAWQKVLVEKFQLRFGDEEDYFDANNDNEEAFGFEMDHSEPESVFTFACEHDRELPPSPQFEFDIKVGPGARSPIAEWTAFFMAHESNYSPSLEFLEARDHIVRVMRETHGEMTKRSVAVEIPVALQLTTARSGNDHFAAHMKQLKDLIESMKRYSAEVAGVTSEETDCRVKSTVTYTLQLLSLDIFGVDMTESCVESVLDLLGTGVPIGSLALNLYVYHHNLIEEGFHVGRQAFAMFLTGVLVGPLGSMLRPVVSIDRLAIICEGDTLWDCEALCSTLASARTPVSTLEIRNGFGNWSLRNLQGVRKRQLELLAEALFYPRAFSGACPTSIRGLSLPTPQLSTVNLEEMTNVVDEKDNVFRIIQNSGQQLLLREGTALRFADSEANATEVVTQSALLLPFQFKVNRKLLNDKASENKMVDVVVSGYGHCSVPRGAVVTRPATGYQAVGEPLSSLSFYHESTEDTLDMLLDRVGWSLKSLSLDFRNIDAAKVMTSIMRTCPLLTSLTIHSCDVNLNRLVTAYERVGKSNSTGISSLVLERIDSIGPDHGVAFAKLLGDPTSRLAKHLRELTIWTAEESEAVNNSTMRALWFSLKNNTKLRKLEMMVVPSVLAPWKKRFRQFHGQVLPPKALSPLLQKLALLSVAHPEGEHETKPLSALHQLDQRALSLVFEFAATRVIRSVEMFYRD